MPVHRYHLWDSSEPDKPQNLAIAGEPGWIERYCGIFGGSDNTDWDYAIFIGAPHCDHHRRQLTTVPASDITGGDPEGIDDLSTEGRAAGIYASVPWRDTLSFDELGAYGCLRTDPSSSRFYFARCDYIGRGFQRY